MKPQYLNAFAGCHLKNAAARFATYDLPYIVGDMVCRLLRTINAIEDFFIADRFPLRPFFSHDKDDDGTLHIRILHTHLIIERRRQQHGFGRSV